MVCLTDEYRMDVALERCDGYDRQEVYRAVKVAVDHLGGLNRFIPAGKRVLLKPNLLQAATPDKCVTPHPAVVWAVGKMLIDHGCKVTLADSPGAGLAYTEAGLRKVYAASGLDKVAEELGITLNFDTTYQSVPNPNGRKVKRFVVISPAIEADAIIGNSHMQYSIGAFCGDLRRPRAGMFYDVEQHFTSTRKQQQPQIFR
jgi:uncharacterized protein (DUF362 family)